MEQSVVKIENTELTARLFGSYDVNVRMLERAFLVMIRNRSGDEGDAVSISGENAESVRMATEAIKALTDLDGGGDVKTSVSLDQKIHILTDCFGDFADTGHCIFQLVFSVI